MRSTSLDIKYYVCGPGGPTLDDDAAKMAFQVLDGTRYHLINPFIL